MLGEVLGFVVAPTVGGVAAGGATATLLAASTALRVGFAATGVGAIASGVITGITLGIYAAWSRDTIINEMVPKIYESMDEKAKANYFSNSQKKFQKIIKILMDEQAL